MSTNIQMLIVCVMLIGAASEGAANAPSVLTESEMDQITAGQLIEWQYEPLDFNDRLSGIFAALQSGIGQPSLAGGIFNQLGASQNTSAVASDFFSRNPNVNSLSELGLSISTFGLGINQ